MGSLTNNEERQAQQIACGEVVKGCQSAIAALEAAPGEPHERPEVRTKQRAREIVTQALSSWRDAMNVITPSQESLWSKADLDEFTSDELFAETLARRAGDGSALRVMQAQTLTAQLTAHDRGPAGSGGKN